MKSIFPIFTGALFLTKKQTSKNAVSTTFKLHNKGRFVYDHTEFIPFIYYIRKKYLPLFLVIGILLENSV